MKKILPIVLSILVSTASAQWSNTSNEFYDSLHMVVSNPLLTQKNPIVLTSYPDGGYFVIWEDERNTATTKADLYAQKYDKNGNALWTAGGMPIANGPNQEHYTFSSGSDYRNRSNAATDSAGGFYIAYSDDSVTNYYFERLFVQHVRSNGTGVFASPGYRVATSNVPNLNFGSQLIADGNKGFYIAYRSIGATEAVYAYNYRDENGTMKFYGGGIANENAAENTSVGGCGIKTDVVYPGTTVAEYYIWPDGQAGCNIIINMAGNIGSQGQILAYNRLFRAKKNAKVKTFFRNTSGVATAKTTSYVKDSVYLLYHIVSDYQNVACGGSGAPLYQYTNTRLLANGYFSVDQSGYDYSFPKGITVTTPGNINIDLLAVSRRTYDNNVLSNFTVQGYAYKAEIFDSIPYQRCSYTNPDFGYNTAAPAGLNKLNFFRDTLLGPGSYFPEFSLAAGGSDIYATGIMTTSGSRWVRLQHLLISKKTADSFAVEYRSSLAAPIQKNGVAIGRESIVGGSEITYDLPLIKVAANGTAVFSIREQGRGTRVSPIRDGSALAWGAMGKPVGTGYYSNAYYNFEQPVVALDAAGSSGLIAWKDNRTMPVNTGENILMRHLDALDVVGYQPPVKRVRLLPNPYGPNFINPAVLLGSSKQYSTIELLNGNIADPGTSPVMDILDDTYLGLVQGSVFQNSGAIRKYNSQPYLSRNYTIKTDSLTPGASISLRLYFTTAEFNALKAADASIVDPGYLSVIRQPGTAAGAPAAYLPVTGEETVTPATWDTVANGFYIQIVAHGTGNFFVQRLGSVNVCSSTTTSFTANITGAAYQWQVNTGGANYTNTSNNTNYSGTNALTLTINNIPSSFSGNRYRCIVDNVKISNAFYLQVGNSWTGAVNNLWQTAGNWSCGSVPDANTDVVISAGTVLVSSNAVCRSLKINPGATVNVATGVKITIGN